MDAFGRGIAIVLAAITVFLIPIKYIAMNQEEALNAHVHSKTVELAEEIMLQGYLTVDMYNTFLNEINAVNQLYDIEIIHGKSTEGYETGSNNSDKVNSYVEEQKVPLGTQAVSSSMKESGGFTPLTLSKKKVSITSTEIDTTETNGIPISLSITPSCYTVFYGSEPTYTLVVTYADNTSKVLTEGYTKTGFTLGAGTKVVTFTYTENDKTVSSSIDILVKRNSKSCSHGHNYELDDYNNDNGCPVCGTIIKSISIAPEYITLVAGSELPITITATYMDESTQTITDGWTSNFDKNKLGNQLVIVTYEGMTAYVSVQVVKDLHCPICGLKYDPDPSGSDPGCPSCSKLVVSINASPESLVIPLGEELKIDVEATYKDGHKELVIDWTTNFNPFKVGNQEVTVFYESVATKIKVKVESKKETTCPICETVYNPIIFPNGCPSCSNIVVGIEARLRNGDTQVQLGSELSLAIILKYKDGQRVINYSGWSIEGYLSNLLGKQDITVHWKEFTTSLRIEIVDTLNKMICTNGHVYYLDEDGNDAGCPYCNDLINSLQSEYYSVCVYTGEILNELYTSGVYYFNEGDYVTIRITPISTSYLQRLKHMFTIFEEENNSYSYGGVVHG